MSLMQKILIPLIVISMAFLVLQGCQSEAEKASPKVEKKSEQTVKADKPTPGCVPEVVALADSAVVILEGKGEGDIVVVTDPLCWHCRLGHKLLGEYPNLYGRVKIVFFPRKSFIGSDMAAWILEDAAESSRIKELVDYAYKDLKQPKTEDLTEARMLVLAQFTEAFPDMLEGTTLPELYAKMQRERSPHVLKSAELGRAAKLPGTPILIAGKAMLVGYGADEWLKALETMEICE